MSSTDRRGNAPSKQKEQSAGAAPAEEPAEPFPDWMDRMQRARVRHAAITRNLNTWSSYKNWADRMRESWDDEEQKPDAGASPTPGGGKKAR
jgi:hypothetical protein